MKTQHTTIPMFPLNIVLFPGETTKLHIFEERYKQLINECLESDASFGIPYSEKGQLKKFGCEVKIKRVLKTYNNGDLDVLVEGVSVFELLEFSSVLLPKLYGVGIVEISNNNQRITLNNLQDAVVNYYTSIQNKFIDYETVSQLTIYNVAASLQLTPFEKYKLISSKNPQFNLLNQLKFITYIINTEKQLKDRFINN